MERYVDTPSPITGGKVKEVFATEEHDFRKEKFLVHVRYYICEDSGEKFSTTEQDELLFNDLYSQYRVKHGLPFPEEIKEIRLRYGLKYSQISKIMGFGANQYASYENGQIPSESNGKMIQSIKDKESMKRLLEASKGEFEPEEFGKIAILIQSSPDAQALSTEQTTLYGNTVRSLYNGFGRIDVTRLKEMIKYFITHENNIYPAKLDRIMFYADFQHFKCFGISISGLTYQSLPYGPAPTHSDTIYDNIPEIKKGLEIIGDHACPTLSCDSYDLSSFDENEKKTMEDALQKIAPLNAPDIIKNGELTDGNALVPYSKAFLIQTLS